jgi:hypothetical protein
LVSRRSYTRLTRNLYRDRFGYRFKKRRLNKEFTQKAGNGPYINPLIVKKDIKQIESLSKIIKKFRHKFIGHHAYNQRRYKAKPTFKQSHDGIDKLAEVFEKYFLLITRTGMTVVNDLEKDDIENDLNMIFNGQKISRK